MLHSACVRVLRRMDVKIANFECPGLEQDADIADFYGIVQSVSVDLLERDPLVKEAVSHLASARLRDLDPAQAELIVRAADEVAAASEGVLAAKLPKDVRLAADPAAPRAERNEALYVTVSRLLRVWAVIERAMKAAAGVSTNLRTVAGDLTILYILLQQAINFILRLF